MLTKFFIDRPIFATVLSVIITLAGGIAMMSLPIAQYPRIAPPSVSVSISYPGASAQVVADSVAAPIEQQVTGVPGMLYMSSQMGNDGTYTLSVTFDVNVDLNTALVMVQNRVALAMPLLPIDVQNQGITIRKKTPDILCMVNFMSAVKYDKTDGTSVVGLKKEDDGETLTLQGLDGKLMHIPKKDIDETKKHKPIYNDIFLSNYALINVKDELLRVDGVSDINIMGERDYSIRAWLDPQKLAARNMTAVDVSSAVQQQNLALAGGQVGQPPTERGQAFQLPIDSLGRLSVPEQFGAIIVKAGPDQPPAGVMAGGVSASTGNMAPTSVDGSTLGTSITGGGTITGGATTGGGANSGGGGSLGGGSTTSGLTSSGSTMSGSTTTGAQNTPAGSTGTGTGATTGAGAKTGTGAATGAGTSGTASFMPINLNKSPKAPKFSAINLPKVSLSKSLAGPKSTSVGVVRLRDVCTKVEMGALNYNISCTFDGGPSVGLSIYQLPGTNALDVGDRVRAKMRELKKRFPDGIDYIIAYDMSPYIRESIGEVFHTLRDAVILVAIVVLFFLQDWRAMILPMIDVPVSLIGTFAVMAAMGYSLNNISLFGLVLAIGIVVDDAIVVLENIERQMAKGYDTRTATIKAMAEISGPILAITLVLCAVFVPCAFISGITGRFFKQFAITIAASTVISAINALTMTPSRALMIFKTSEEAGGHHRKPEALPWWIFGLLGMATLSWGPGLMAPLGLPAPTGFEDENPLPAWQSWALTAVYFTPGMLAGLALGWFIIKPVNAVLGVVFRGFNRGFDAMTTLYGHTIAMGLRLSFIVLVGYAGVMFFTYHTFRTAPTGFVPQQDMGRLIASVQLPDSASLDRTQAQMAEVERIILGTPGVAHSIGMSGISFIEQANASNFGSLFIILKPFAERQERELRADFIMARLKRRWAREIKDARVVVLNSSPVPGVSVAGGMRLMVEDRGGLGLPTLQAQTDRLVATLRKDIGETAGKQKPKTDNDDEQTFHGRPMVNNVSTQFRSNTPQLFFDIDRAKVASVGCSLDDVNQTLQIFLGSQYVNSFNEFGRHWQVTLQADLDYRSKVDNINQLQVRNNKGQMVQLGTLGTVREQSGPIFVKRYNLYQAAPVSGAILPGVSSGDVITAVNDLSDESLPRSMKAEWTELMFMQIREGSTTGIIFTLAVVCVFLALSALYESWTLPLAVILVVPLCVLSSIRGVMFRNDVLGQDASVDVFVQIGLVVLVGLACKNAILVVEFARELHVAGRSVFEATLESSRLRLRPILMTSFAFILGVLPLCVASGAGAEMRRSLGVAVFSGMLGVTAFGIFVTPVFFYVIQGVGEARIFSGAIVQWLGSSVLGAGLGMGAGYLLARLGVVHMNVAVGVGGFLGVLAVLAVRGVHLRIRDSWTLGEGETERKGDRETRRQGDKETGRQGDE